MHVRRRILLVVSAGAVLFALGFLPSHRLAQQKREQKKCLQYLLQVNEVLNCCVPLEKKMKPGDPIAPNDVLDFMKDRVLPRCPSGCKYLVPYVAGGRPVCPRHGDLLREVAQVNVFGSQAIYLKRSPGE